jgi:hypothetical protein
MKKLYFLIFLLSSFGLSAQNNITFSVDMSGQSFTQAYISGSFNGWSGDANALTDLTGGIWEITLPIADGEYEYKFTYDNWTGQDTFTQGDVCTITNYGNTNRRLVVAGADQTLATAPFNGCAESATNPGPHSITINVDMNGYGGALGTVYINGENHNAQGLGNWCGACGNDMTDQGAGIWSTTLSLEEFSYQFKFTVDGWSDQEGFNPGDTQTATDGTNTNRYINVDGAKTLNYVWNQSSRVLGLKDVKNISSVKAFPNPTNNVWNIQTNNQTIKSIVVFDVLGKQVLSRMPNTSSAIINSKDLSNGLYFAKVKTNSGEANLRLVKN